MRLSKCFAYGLVLGTVLATPAMAVEPDAPERLITRADAVRILVQGKLGQPFRDETEYQKAEHGALVEYYADSDQKTIWVDEHGLRPKARLIIKELQRAGDYGLNSDDYDLPQEIILAANDETPSERLAEVEYKLSHAVLAYARHARGGRFAPQTISKMLDPTLELPDPLAVMEKLASLDDPAPYLRDFHPKHEQFELLRQALIRARGGSIEEKRIVIPNGPVLKPGESHRHVALLRKRLEVEAPAKDVSEMAADDKDGKTKSASKKADPAEVYDAELVEAIKKFQKEKGLQVDGIVGPGTRRALNGGAAPKNRIKTILTNMERWRWIPNNIDGLNVQANVPEFRFRVLDGEKLLHSERIVVGKAKNPTPVFSDKMEHIVFNPYWNVPNSIKKEEILPHLRSGGGGGGWFWGGGSSRPRILQAHNLYVKFRGRQIDASSVDWSRVNIANYHFYQPPGGPNVLGVVKFMFPNKHSVYMHDTPTKSLFDKPVRAYSHGCMRVRDPLKFAEVLLGRDRGWSRGNINSAVSSGTNQHVNLNNPIPVHVTYFTARVEKSGKITFFGDIYGHDSRMAAAMKL
jgi:murein L,D-transpeptidase YcbB/YkuD